MQDVKPSLAEKKNRELQEPFLREQRLQETAAKITQISTEAETIAMLDNKGPV